MRAFTPSAEVWIRRSIAASIAATALLALSACTSMQVRMGWKVYLDRTPVASIQASLPQGPAIGPGQKSPLVVVFTEPTGKTLTTEGKGQGKVMWKELRVAATVVTVNQKGIVSLPKDPRISDGKIAHVTITVPSHPDLRADLDIPLRYDEKYVSNFSGSPGISGMNGLDGTDGISGSPGSSDPNNPSPGGDGGNGTDGSNGQDGGQGGDAPPVNVRVAFRAGVHPLLQVSVSAAGKQKFYLIDPHGGSLTVNADGGSGGSGGRGGRGGRGGSGGSGSPNGSSGRDGSDGRNGWDGSHGAGGLITITYDPQVKPYLNILHFSAQYGPAPVFKEESVAALW
jgi:hypothetical protein